MRGLPAIALLLVAAGCSSGNNTNAQNTAAPASSPAMQSTSSEHTVTVHTSTRTFKEIDAACAGGLGGITFAMNHVRTHALEGVDIHHTSDRQGVWTVTFTDSARNKTATVKANGHDHTVSGTNVVPAAHGSIACIK